MGNLVFGCGYLGSQVARAWVAAEKQVTAVTRNPARAVELYNRSVAGIVADITRPGTLDVLPAAETVLFAVSYDRAATDATQTIRNVLIDGLKNVLARVVCRRFIYISTCGVYAQDDGGWVNEDSPPCPTYETARIILEAEDLVRARRNPAAHAPGSPEEFTGGPPLTTVLRLAGIYGPDRVPKLKSLKAGEPIACPTEGWLNLIHVEDAAAAVVAVEDAADPPSILNVSDGCPVQRREFYREAARQAGAPPPKFIDPPRDAAERGRGGSNRRIDSSLMLRLLKAKLQFPSYRDGLADVLKE